MSHLIWKINDTCFDERDEDWPYCGYKDVDPAGHDKYAQTLREAWKKATYLKIEDVGSVLNRGLGAKEIVLKADIFDGVGFDRLRVFLDKKVNGFGDSHSFSFPRSKVFEGDLNVDNQKSGIGRILLRNQIELAYALNLDRFEIEATKSAGGYAWARFGFELTDEEVRGLKIKDSYLYCGLNARVQAIKKYLPSNEFEKIQLALDNPNPRSLWEIADCRYDVAPILGHWFRPPRLTWAFSRSSELHVDEIYEQARSKDGSLPLGRALLSSLSWEGKLDLRSDDKTALIRAGQYSGGWSLIDTGPPALE